MTIPRGRRELLVAIFITCQGLCALPGMMSEAHASDWFATGAASLSDDTDDFRTRQVSGGFGRYLSDDNFIDRLAYRRTLHQFRAPGFALDGHSDGVVGDLALTDRLTAHAEVLAFRSDGPRATLGGASLVGDLPWDFHLELNWETGLVDSVRSLSSEVRFDAATVAVDKTVAERFNLALAATRLDFSDDNTRDQLRARASYRIIDDHGVHLYLRTRQYSNSRPFTGNYFSPEDLQETLVGSSVRRRVPGLTAFVSGWIDVGRQTVDGASTSIRSWQLKLEAFPLRPWHFALVGGEQTTAGTGGGPDYAYRYLSGSAVIPF